MSKQEEWCKVFDSKGCCSECYEKGVNDGLKHAASIAKGKIDPEWPGDDMSTQANSIASEILELVF